MDRKPDRGLVRTQAGRAALDRVARLAGLASATMLAGCSTGGAPTIALFGAYFPSWLACALAGIVGAVVVRLVFIALGLDDILPARLPVYAGIAASIGFLVSLVGFGR